MMHHGQWVRWTVLASAALLCLAACEPKKSGGGTQANRATSAQGSSATTAASNTGMKPDEQAVMLKETLALLEKGEGLKEAHYEALMLDLATCSIDEKGFLDQKCPALERLTDVKKRRNRHIKNMTAMWSRIGQKHLDNPSPSVRLYAVQKLGSLFTVNDAGQKILLTAAKKETSPPVLVTMVRTSRNAMGKQPALAAFVLEQSKHQNKDVRREALLALVSPWAMGTPDTLERAMEMIRTDPEMEIRKLGCAGIGARADDNAIPLLEEYTVWPAKEKELYDDCFRGLVEMWAARVVHKRPSQAAYELTLKRLEEKPRSQEHPSWKSIASLGIGGREQFIERAPWYDAKRVNAVLVDMIADTDFHWLGRRSAIDAYALAGASSAQMQALLDQHFAGGLVKKDTDQYDRFLSRQLEKRIEETKSYEKQQKELAADKAKDKDGSSTEEKQ